MSPLPFCLLSLPHTLCLSCNRNSLPLSLILSFYPYIQLPPRLYQWGFWFHYCRGQSFLFRQGEWNTTRAHSELQMYTQKHTQIKSSRTLGRHNFKVWIEELNAILSLKLDSSSSRHIRNFGWLLQYGFPIWCKVHMWTRCTSLLQEFLINSWDIYNDLMS